MENKLKPFDLEAAKAMAPTKHRAYANIYKGNGYIIGSWFDNYNDAVRGGKASAEYVATVLVEWED